MAFTSVLVIFAVLKGLTLIMPVSAFRLAFTNGLMSESMILWFGAMLIWERHDKVPDPDPDKSAPANDSGEEERT